MNNDFDLFVDFTKRRLNVGDEQMNQYIQGVYQEFGGARLYINKGYSQRNQQIRDSYTGHNADELAIQYGICRRQIFNILNE